MAFQDAPVWLQPSGMGPQNLPVFPHDLNMVKMMVGHDGCNSLHALFYVPKENPDMIFWFFFISDLSYLTKFDEMKRIKHEITYILVGPNIIS